MKRRFFHKCIVILLCIGLLVPNQVASTIVAATRKGTVTASTLNVRAKPSTSAKRYSLMTELMFIYVEMKP